MKCYKIAKFALLIAAILLLATGCASILPKKYDKHAARLLIRLPASCNTPDGADGSLDQPCEVLIRGNELIVISMDMPWKDPTGLLVNTKIDEPYTISVIPLGRGDM